ncbi:unnamed protein product [Rodentolepis nana]|uniref:Kinesin motor domain-containing protein n=1 Tax=Rodentolepis nana TaxID=102285 RepID=A0A0R3T6J6_RODNA|nr:unnamed protein product [Rodentolepis nana]
MAAPDDNTPSKIKTDSQLGPSARRLQHTLPKSSTLGPAEYAVSKSPGAPNLFFRTFRIRRRNSSVTKVFSSTKIESDRSLLSTSMIAEASPTKNPISTNFRSRLHRSAGSINLCDNAMGAPSPKANKEPLSAITSDVNNTSPVLKSSSRPGQGKPRQLKRRRAGGFHPKSASVEPHPDEIALSVVTEPPVFRDDCSVMVYSKSIDHSFTTGSRTNCTEGNDALSSHRRTRSASGSNTKLGSLWSFICNGSAASAATRRANESIAVPS